MADYRNMLADDANADYVPVWSHGTFESDARCLWQASKAKQCDASSEADEEILAGGLRRSKSGAYWKATAP